MSSKGDKIPAQYEIYLESIHTFPLTRKRWLCQEIVFVSDNWQRPHYEMKHPMNEGQPLLTYVASKLY